MNEEFQLIIAALLHDIGKLGYRAGELGAHEEIGKKFVESQEHALPHEITSLISMHHRHGIENLFGEEGYAPLKKIIIADWLASSERIGLEQTEEIKKIGLTPIFSKISIFGEHSPSKFYYSGQELILKNGSEELFPHLENKISGKLQNNFTYNWNSFKAKFERISDYKGNDQKLFEFLYYLLKSHFKFLPSAAYKVEPDISLFDHSKMVCALTIALHNYFKFNSIAEEDANNSLNLVGKILQELYRVGDDYIEEIEKDQLKKEVFEDLKFFSLVHGDFSGIQNFIHSISSRYAMKTLKGRSFFFGLLTENFARYITQELELTEANIIYAGGGHFFIISHYSSELDTKIKEFSIKINKFFIELFNSNLYLALDYIPLSIKDLTKGISESWKEISSKTSLKKKRKFKDILEESGKDYFSEIFGPIKGSATKLERCVVCNSFTELENIETEGEDKWCSTCKGFMQLTVDLKRSKYYGIIQNSNEAYNKILNEIKNAVEFAESAGANLKNSFSINNPSILKALGVKLSPIAFPLNQLGNIVNTETLAERAAERTGFNKLGILKMDVDSLGKIFQKGLGDNSTISRISTLSSSLSLFFEGYVSILAKTKFPGSIYLIFSGGDDLFAIGSWDKIIEFSYKLYKKFRRFTVFNPDITLSGGIVIETASFPIIRASLAAEEELDKAKNFEPFTGKVNTKNRISLFGSVLKWDWTLEKEVEYREVIQKGEDIEKYERNKILEIMKNDNSKQVDESIFNWVNTKSEFELANILKDILVYLVKEKGFSKSMLHKVGNSVRGMRSLLEDSVAEGRIKVPKLWRMKYYLRTVLRSKDPEVKLLSNFIVQMLESIVKNNLFELNSNLKIKNVEFISVAVKWADYLTRTIK